MKDPNDATNTKTMSVIINERIGEPKEADPPVHLLAGASDFLPFLQNLGVSAADFHYAFGYKNRAMVNPLLNSRHDTFDYIKKKLDPKFQFHLAMAKLAGGRLSKSASSSELCRARVFVFVLVLVLALVLVLVSVLVLVLVLVLVY